MQIRDISFAKDQEVAHTTYQPRDSKSFAKSRRPLNGGSRSKNLPRLKLPSLIWSKTHGPNFDSLRFSEGTPKMVELGGRPCFHIGFVSKNPGKGSGHGLS